MNWEKLQQTNFFTEPVVHIKSLTVFDTQEYDRLYENQNNLQHPLWKQFIKKYNINFTFHENFDTVDLTKDIICLWFFRERNYHHLSHVVLEGHEIPYMANTFLVTKSNKIKFREHSKKKYIRYPVVQLDIKENAWQDIIKRFQK
jgi:hypothetical protein